ncbi:MAG: hypothetical protein R3C45_20530 [Phycisphaerales bacterium]
MQLSGFAVYVRQITPTFIEYPTSPATWCLGLLGFALLFPVYARLPRGWGACGHQRVAAGQVSRRRSA